MQPTCNATTTGWHRRFPTTVTGNSTGTLDPTDFSSASVTVLNGSRCNTTATSSCGKATRAGRRLRPVRA